MIKELHEWFQKNKRDFPWRLDRNPYRVWISEVMLQQTRASVVVPYFEKWLSLFPDVVALAEAPIELVLKTWEGLGYYSRARNLHLGAKQILSQFGGEIPSRAEDLAKIRGLGDYTIGAILSFGFGERVAAVDGNVTRVLSRYFAIRERIDRASVKRVVRDYAKSLLDEEAPWITNEALIELGATVCLPKPRCLECPLQHQCLGLKQNVAEGLPVKKEERKITELRRAVVLIEAEWSFLIKKGTSGQVMADLYEFPYFEMEKDVWEIKEVMQRIKEWGMRVEWVRKLPLVKHSFTRYRATLYPWLFKGLFAEIPGFEWASRERLQMLPFSSGHRKILGFLQ